MSLVASQSQTPPPSRIGFGAFVLAGLSFIPLLSLPFGLTAMMWGLLSKRPGRWAVVAAAGAALTLYGSLLCFGLLV